MKNVMEDKGQLACDKHTHDSVDNDINFPDFPLAVVISSRHRKSDTTDSHCMKGKQKHNRSNNRWWMSKC